MELRPATPADGDALVALALASADTGRVRVSPRYLRNPIEASAALAPDLTWVVAEENGELVGAAVYGLEEAREVEGERYPGASLGSLMVHPAHRRRGVARALTEWRLERIGPEAVVVAAIQTGNEGSFANARKWATQIFGSLVIPLFDPIDRYEGPTVREPADDGDWEAYAEGLAAFERGVNLRTPQTAASLRERASRTLDGERLRYAYVAVERGRVVGGIELFESGRLQTLVIEHLPPELRLLNLVLRLMPPEGELKETGTSSFWFERVEIGRSLWAFARAKAAERTNTVGTRFDPRGPLSAVINVRPWTPKGKIAIAVRSPVTLDEERLLSPP
jgi:GNAT superfamily N-acetyltransferase